MVGKAIQGAATPSRGLFWEPALAAQRLVDVWCCQKLSIQISSKPPPIQSISTLVSHKPADSHQNGRLHSMALSGDGVSAEGCKVRAQC